MVEAVAGTRIDVTPSVGWLAELAVTLGTEVKPGTVEAVAFFADQAVQVVVGWVRGARCRPPTSAARAAGHIATAT